MSEPERLDVNDPRVLDRLVDGELNDAEERAVIAQLSQAPGGWRACALAFLEARCWQRVAQATPPDNASPDNELHEPARFSPQASATPAARPSHAAPRWRWSLGLELAALFVLALGAGTMLPRPWKQTAEQTGSQSPTPLQLVDTNPAATQNVVDHQPLHASENVPLGNVTLVDSAGGQCTVPVYDWDEELADQLLYRSRSLPPFIEQLKRHQVKSQQRYVPVRLQDGRQVVIPVQELKIIPVGGIAY